MVTLYQTMAGNVWEWDSASGTILFNGLDTFEGMTLGNESTELGAHCRIQSLMMRGIK